MIANTENNPDMENHVNPESLKHGEALHEDDHDISEQEHSDSEDEHSEFEHEHEEHVYDFSEMQKSELVAFLDGVLKSDKILAFSRYVADAKDRYNEIFEAERRASLEAFLAIEGNNEIDFQYPLDFIDRQWRDMFRTFSGKKKAIFQARIAEKENNLKLKTELIEQLKALVEKAAEPESFSVLKSLQDQWRSIGPVLPGDAEHLYKNYRYLNDKFFSERSIYKELIELDKKKNLETKFEIIESIKVLANGDNLVEILRSIKSFQETWKDVGPVPKENLDELMNAYREANELITRKKEELVGVVEKERAENLALKEAVIEKIHELTGDETERTWVIRNQELSKLITVWKKIGAVPRKDNERIRNAFRDAVKAFNQLKNTFFREQKKEKLHNFQLKVDACEKVEKILASEDLKSHRDEVIKLQKFWRTIGATPKKQSEEIWKRFRTACDEFFNRLKDADNAHLTEQIENLAKKQEICAKIEAISTEEAGSMEALELLENEWQSVGFVPIKDKKDIDKRFHDAVRMVLKTTIKLTNQDPELDDYKAKVEEILRSDNASGSIDKELIYIKKRIQTKNEELNTIETNIHFFANSKNAQKLVSGFTDKIDEIKTEIALLHKKANLLQQSYEFTRN